MWRTLVKSFDSKNNDRVFMLMFNKARKMGSVVGLRTIAECDLFSLLRKEGQSSRNFRLKLEVPAQ